MAHVPPSYLEQGGMGEEEEDDEEEGLSLWSCIKNRLRRKKCTCHLNNIGEGCVTSKMHHYDKFLTFLLCSESPRKVICD